MKRFAVSLAVLAVVFLAGCSGSENSSPTSGGSNTLSGKVILGGDLQGASPAGIQVSAKGTGLSTQLDPTGSFTLLGTPSGSVELSFSRQSDGIDAASTVSGNANGVVIQLQRRRAVVLAPGQSKVEIEGTITEVSATSITVNDARSHADVTAAINDQTVIRKGNTTVAAADLKKNDRVHVRASIGADNVLTALEIKLQNPSDDNPGSATGQLEGIVTEVGDSSITVADASSHQDVEVEVTDTTIIRHGNETLTLEDIHEGDRVHVKAVADAEGNLTALEIKLQNPGGGDGPVAGKKEFEGPIVAVSDTSITILDASTHGDVTATITEDTEIRKGNTKLTPGDLHIGDRVHIKATADEEGNLTANEIKLQNPGA